MISYIGANLVPLGVKLEPLEANLGPLGANLGRLGATPELLDLSHEHVGVLWGSRRAKQGPLGEG